jgi:hypothetical protein
MLGLGLGGLLTASACSSVPDVTFVEDDAGASSNPEAGSSGSTSGSTGGADGGDAGPAKPKWSCPSSEPPAADGICCGNRLCLGCAPSDCGRCEQKGCAGTLDDLCCIGNGSAIDCRAWSACDR